MLLKKTGFTLIAVFTLALGKGWASRTTLPNLGATLLLGRFLRKKRRQLRDHVRRLIERCHPNMRLIRAEIIADGNKARSIDRRMRGADNATSPCSIARFDDLLWRTLSV